MSHIHEAVRPAVLTVSHIHEAFLCCPSRSSHNVTHPRGFSLLSVPQFSQCHTSMILRCPSRSSHSVTHPRGFSLLSVPQFSQCHTSMILRCPSRSSHSVTHPRVFSLLSVAQFSQCHTPTRFFSAARPAVLTVSHIPDACLGCPSCSSHSVTHP